MTRYKILFGLYLLLFILTGCARKISYVGDPAGAPPATRPAHLPLEILNKDKCGPHCVKMFEASRATHFLDRARALKIIAREKSLTGHEQLHLIDCSLELEMFGLNEIFEELARHPYLRHTPRQYLLYYTNRLLPSESEAVTRLVLANPGVPDELTPMEKLWKGAFGIDQYAILDLYKKGIPPEDILTIFYLGRISNRKSEMIAKWRKQGDTWYKIILKRLELNPKIIFPALKPCKEIPEPFYRSYQLYWLGLDKFTLLTDKEVCRIIQLKVVTTYYSLDPLEVMKEITRDKTFNEIISRMRKPK